MSKKEQKMSPEKLAQEIPEDVLKKINSLFSKALDKQIDLVDLAEKNPEEREEETKKIQSDLKKKKDEDGDKIDEAGGVGEAVFFLATLLPLLLNSLGNLIDFTNAKLGVSLTKEEWREYKFITSFERAYNKLLKSEEKCEFTFEGETFNYTWENWTELGEKADEMYVKLFNKKPFFSWKYAVKNESIYNNFASDTTIKKFRFLKKYDEFMLLEGGGKYTNYIDDITSGLTSGHGEEEKIDTRSRVVTLKSGEKVNVPHSGKKLEEYAKDIEGFIKGLTDKIKEFPTLANPGMLKDEKGHPMGTKKANQKFEEWKKKKEYYIELLPLVKDLIEVGKKSDVEDADKKQQKSQDEKDHVDKNYKPLKNEDDDYNFVLNDLNRIKDISAKRLPVKTKVGNALKKVGHGLHRLYTVPLLWILWGSRIFIPKKTIAGDWIRKYENRVIIADMVYVMFMLFLLGPAIWDKCQHLKGVETYGMLILKTWKASDNVKDGVKNIIKLVWPGMDSSEH